jgi:hypothetical protein
VRSLLFFLFLFHEKVTKPYRMELQLNSDH